MKLALVLVAGGALGIVPNGSTQSIAPLRQRFVCDSGHTNFAWGYQHSGIYVDRDGAVYRFAVRTNRFPRLLQTPDLTEAEMDEKYGSERKLIRTLPTDEVRAMYDLIPGAAKGALSKRVPRGMDMGASVSACYLFDATSKRYRKVELDVTGDWEYRNLAPEARKLAAWLASLASTTQEKK